MDRVNVISYLVFNCGGFLSGSDCLFRFRLHLIQLCLKFQKLHFLFPKADHLMHNEQTKQNEDDILHGALLMICIFLLHPAKHPEMQAWKERSVFRNSLQSQYPVLHHGQSESQGWSCLHAMAGQAVLSYPP